MFWGRLLVDIARNYRRTHYSETEGSLGSVSIMEAPMKHDEFDFQCLVVSSLERSGVPVFSVPNHLMRNGLAELRRETKAGFRKGAPDLIAGKDGKSYWLELKTPTGKQSAEQVAFSSVAHLFGAEYRVVRTLDDIKDLCDGEGS